MSEVILNNKPLEIVPGEGLLAAARREGAHIGFLCDGNGLCTTCECRVIEGEANLSVPNTAEKDWLPPSRLAKGYRLACQAQYVRPGRVELISRVEEFRRQCNRVLNPPEGTTYDRELTRLYALAADLTIAHLSQFPANLLRTMNRIGVIKTILPVKNNTQWLRDIGRVIDNVSNGAFNDGSLKRPPRRSAPTAPIPPVVVEDVLD